MGRIEIEYFRCSLCGFLQTETPHWLAEAYASPINRSDVGYISRNLRLRKATPLILDWFFDAHGDFLDYGSGYGMFVRMMRDQGYRFQGFDPFCKSLFAPDFTLSGRLDGHFEAVTAFEVFEHLEHPARVFSDLLAISDTIIFTTELVPDELPAPQDWQYFGLDHGQHVSFATKKALALLAEKNGARYFHCGSDLHIISRKKISRISIYLVGKDKIQKMWSVRLKRRKTLLPQDHQQILTRLATSSTPGEHSHV